MVMNTNKPLKNGVKNNIMSKVAIILRGGVSKKNGKIKLNEFDTDYVNYNSVFLSIQRHIVDANSNFTFDFFIHSWSYPLENELNNLYKPVAFEYEDNSNYHGIIIEKLRSCGVSDNVFSTVSESLSISKSCQLFLDYSNNNSIDYEYVILYRPDVLIWKDLLLSEYSKEIVYSSSFLKANGDFHFVFEPKKIFGFIDLFDGLSIHNKPHPHESIKHHLTHKHHYQMSNDNIIGGLHQEVVRKLNLLEIDKEFLTEYGITLEEIKTYNPY